MALTISDADFGRSTEGKQTLKNNFNTDINNIKKVLNGDKYKALKNTVNASWVGEDANDFLNDVEKTRADLEKKLDELKTKFNNALDEDEKQFLNFQAKNVQ